MDSLTQIVLGAAVGEVIVGSKAGNKGAFWGAICGTIPDLDVVFGSFMSDLDRNTFHRSVSHSLLFFVLAAPITGWLIKRVHPYVPVSWRQWSLLAFWAYFTHALLDCFTTWGTQLFWPLGYKVAFKSIFVVDPLYTLPLLVFLLLGLRLSKTARRRKVLVWVGIGASTCYLLFTLFNKQFVERHFKEALEREEISFSRFETKPAPFNNILWAATAETHTGYYIGYYSLLDRVTTNFQYFPKNHVLLEELILNAKVQQLVRLTEGWYTVEKSKDGLRVNDLRFGTITAWEKGRDFVFAYQVTSNPDGSVIVSEVPKSVPEDPWILVKKLGKRIMGNDDA